jgi:hypothetical protein
MWDWTITQVKKMTNEQDLNCMAQLIAHSDDDFEEDDEFRELLWALIREHTDRPLSSGSLSA